MKGKSDFIFLALIGLIVVNTITQSIIFDYLLSFNNYLGFVCLPIVLASRILKPRAGRYAIVVLLLLSSFNIINFGIAKVSLSFSIGGLGEGIGLNPIMLIILIGYYLVNRRSINQRLSKYINGPADEQQNDQQKMVEFYVRKFENCAAEEMEAIIKNFNHYPPEAQIALKRVCNLKGISLQ